jgi:hypothetical protein
LFLPTDSDCLGGCAERRCLSRDGPIKSLCGPWTESAWVTEVEMWRCGGAVLRAVAVRTGGGTVTVSPHPTPLSARAPRARRRMRTQAARAEDAGAQADEEALTCVWVDGSNLADMSMDRLEALYTQVGRSTHRHTPGHRRALTGGELAGGGEPRQRRTSLAGCHVRPSGGEPPPATTAPLFGHSRKDLTHAPVLCCAGLSAQETRPRCSNSARGRSRTPRQLPG